MTKKWIYEGEFRCGRNGDNCLNFEDGAVFQPKLTLADDELFFKFPILHPIPDDVVMVPREKIEALRKDRWCQPVASGGLRYQLPSAYHAAIDAILACAEPAKPKDEILEALRRCRNTLNRDRVNCTTDIIQVTDSAIALREKELKERGE